jgi:hypothetical protein
MASKSQAKQIVAMLGLFFLGMSCVMLWRYTQEAKYMDEVHRAESEAAQARAAQNAADAKATKQVNEIHLAAAQRVRAADSRAAKAQAEIDAAESKAARAQAEQQSADGNSMQVIFLMGMLTALVLAEIARRPQVVALKERVSGQVARAHEKISGKVGRVNDKRQPLLHVDGPILGA